MPREAIGLGSTPHNEPCVQVSIDYNTDAARKEYRVYRDQLIRMHGDPPNGIHYHIKNNCHDFGSYYELEIIFDVENEAHWKYAIKIESESPSHWDDVAKKQLGL